MLTDSPPPIVSRAECPADAECRTEYEELEAREAATDADFAEWVARWLAKKGWDQTRVATATRRRISRSRVSQLAIYGRWRKSSNVSTLTSKKMTERSFAEHWKRTEKQDHEDLRFAAVDRMIDAGEVPYPDTAPKPQPEPAPEGSPVGIRIRDLMQDGVPRTVDEIHEALGGNRQTIYKNLREMETKALHNAVVEREPWKGDERWHIRFVDPEIVDQLRAVRFADVRRKVLGLCRQGIQLTENHLTRYDPHHVASILHEIKVLHEGIIQ